jgi:hypothetical protein
MFLDKTEIRKIDFFRYMENRPLLKENKETIIEELMISEFLLNRTMEELNTDFKQYELVEDFELVETNTTIELLENGLGTSKQLETIYVEKSMAFSMMLELLFENFQSVNDYADKNFISFSPVYKKLKVMRKFFEQFSFTITKKFTFEGNEKKLRHFFLHALFEQMHQELSIYPENIVKKSLHFLKTVQEHRKMGMQEYAKLKLLHFLNITFLRIERGHTITEEKRIVSSSYLNESPHAKWIREWLEKEMKMIDKKRIEYEVDEILAYLVGEEIIKSRGYLGFVNDKSFQLDSLEFVETVQSKFPFAKQFKKKNYKRIALFHFYTVNFTLENIEYDKNLDINYFVDNYPEYVSFCKEYIEGKKNQRHIWKRKEFYFYNYLLLLVDKLPLQEFLQPIYLYIDFSFGKIYNRMIVRNINKLFELNITYQKSIDEQTDLILSDIYFAEFEMISQIIWLAPPRAIDWGNFSNHIARLRKEKRTLIPKE